MSYLNTDEFTTPFLSIKSGVTVNKPGLDFFFKRTQLPFIGRTDLTNYITDPDLKRLEDAMIKDTLPHRQKSFHRDNIAQSFAHMTIAVLVGEGINATVQKENKPRTDASKIIASWNDNVNVRHESIEDYIKSVWIDNLIDHQSLWRVFIDKEADQLVDLQRVSMSTIRTQTHPTRGWRRFIQRHNVPKHQMSKSVWYRTDPMALKDLIWTETIIPDEPQCCLYISFFDKPPVSSVLHLMVYKRWITWFMRKFAEKFWAPFLIGYIGDPANGYMPQTKEDQDDAVMYMGSALRKVRDFGAMSTLATNRVEVLDTKTAKNAEIYVSYLEYLNKEIILGLLGSMALREGRGREGVSSDIVQQGFLRFIRGKRESIGIKLRKFYSEVLLPAYGIEDLTPIDIKIDWPPIRLESIKDILESVEIAAKIGALRDAKEIRKILTPIWRHIDDNISDEEVKKAKELFLEINSPSRAEGDSPQQRGGASAKGSTTTKKTTK